MPTGLNNMSFALAAITTEKFEIIKESFSENATIQLGSNLRFSSNNTSQLISIFASFRFESDSNSFIILEVGCHFKIEDKTWSEIYDNETLKLIVPKGFITHLSVLTIGTCRGVLHAKTENTHFNKFFLPVIDVTQLIQKDVSFQFQSENE